MGNINRRNFLKRSAVVTGGLANLGLLSACTEATATHYPFGLQLYTLRADMPADPDGVLRQVASFGYTQLEGFEGPSGMFWGKTPQEFSRFVGDLGMEMIASHCGIDEGFEQKADDAAAAGMQYLICPMIGAQASLDDYRRFAERFNECGEICKNVGLRFAYHNHHYTFIELEGAMPQDVLMQNTDPELVEYELDMFWLVAAGGDPIEWLRKYPGRFPFSHVKDRLPNMPGDSRTATCSLGTGIIDYPTILPIAYETGMRYFIVEQESYEGTTPLDSSRDNAEYMRQFRF